MTAAPYRQDLRPKLRQDTAFLLSADVTYVRNGSGSAVIKSRSAYRWLVTLGPHLTGKHTIDQLCGDLPAAQRDTVTSLISMLIDQGFAWNVEPSVTNALPDAVREQFAAQLAFIEHFADRPDERFQALRTSRVLLVGGGESLRAAGAGLLRNGLARLTIASPGTSTGTPDTDTIEALAGEARSLTGLGVPAEVVVAEADLTGLDLGGLDLVAYCGDQVSLGDVHDLDERCHQAGVPFLPLVVIGTQALIGPLTRRADVGSRPEGPCWTCALLRITSNADPTLSARAWRDIALRPPPAAALPLPAGVARMLGNAVAFEIFARLTGYLPADVEAGVVLQDLDTLSAAREPLLTHPLCPRCAAPTNDPTPAPGGLTLAGMPPTGPADGDPPSPDLADGDLTDGDQDTDEPSAEQLYAYGEPLFGRHAGPLREFIDDPIVQIPLKVGAVRLGDPTGRVPHLDVAAFDVDNLLDARNAATGLALIVYGQRLFDPRTAVLGSFAELDRAGRHPVPPARLATWSGAATPATDTPLSWVAGRRLHDGQVCLVPAGAVYPNSPANHDLSWERAASGLAWATSPARLAGTGLLRALGHARLCQLARGTTTVVEVDLDRLTDADPRLGFLIRSAGHLCHRVRVLEVLGASGVHVHLVTGSDTTTPTDPADASSPADECLPADAGWSAGVGWSGTEAALDALRAFVGRHQLSGQPSGAEAGICLEEPLLADLTPGTELRFDEPTASRFEAPRTEIKEAHARVRAAGGNVVLVDITPPDVAGAGPLRVGRALLVTPDATHRG